MTSDTPNMLNIVERLEKVERQNRRMKQAGVAILVCCIAALVMGQASPNSRILDAEELIIRDKAGNIRAMLSVSEKGPSLYLSGAKGNPLVMLSVSEKGPSLYLSDANGKLRVSLSVSGKGPSLNLYGANMERRAVLSMVEALPCPLRREREGTNVNRRIER